jgi:putative transposase
MREWKKQSYVTWYCLYHVVFIPKYRKKAIFGRLRSEIGGIFYELCTQFGIGLVEGHAQTDHIRMCLSIPPRYAVAHAVGRLKGKSAILIHRRFPGKGKNLTGYHFWARGYCVSTVGLDDAVVRQYIRDQEAHEQQLDQHVLPMK